LVIQVLTQMWFKSISGIIDEGENGNRMRTGVVFVDIATRGTLYPEEDEIIQLSAVKLSRNGCNEYNMYALPREISRADKNKHGFFLDGNRRESLFKGRRRVGPCLDSHKDLLVSFGVWLDVRYDEVILVSMDDRKNDLLADGLNRLVRDNHFRMPDLNFKNVRDIFWDNLLPLHGKRFTAREILLRYDGYRLKCDTLKSARSLRRACIHAAEDLGILPLEFIRFMDDSRDDGGCDCDDCLDASESSDDDDDEGYDDGGRPLLIRLQLR